MTKLQRPVTASSALFSEDIASTEDYDIYFDLPAAAVGTGQWREEITNLLERVEADMKQAEVAPEDADLIVEILLRIRQIRRPSSDSGG